MKVLAIHDINQPQNELLLYIVTLCLLIFLVSAAKSDMFNIFKVIRSTIPFIKMTILHLRNDYKDWKNGVGYYGKRKV